MLMVSKDMEPNQYPVYPEQAEGDDSDYKQNPYAPV
jgi:hypothetical protein